ncbi:indole-3-glycerol phosphate synthase TrpC [bacterium]|nr:indole-3-glycerol phosphate synthase TrpC [bacterium]
MATPTVLERIIDVKRTELAALRKHTTPEALSEAAAAAPPTRGFLASLKHAADNGSMGLIAEVKKASPSKGIIRADFDPVWIASRYAAGGANCLSVLTDEQFFQGSLDYLRAVRAAVALPIIRKDFTIDRIQLLEARAAGADAILLIAACLDPHHLVDLHEEARAIGLDVLVEIHDEQEWEGLLSTGTRFPLVGVNNRNLHTFEVSLETTERLASAVLAHADVLVAESGIFLPADVRRLYACGARAILVGESLMRQSDPGEAARTLLS